MREQLWACAAYAVMMIVVAVNHRSKPQMDAKIMGHAREMCDLLY